jgi:hypothetical protein
MMDQLLLSCKGLSPSTLCRFIPALPDVPDIPLTVKRTTIWISIPMINATIIALFVIIVVVIGAWLITENNASKWNAIATLVGSGTAIVLLFSIFNQVTLQGQQLQLEYRPHLGFRVAPVKPNMPLLWQKDDKAIYGGGVVYLMNSGNKPATNVKAAGLVVTSNIERDTDRLMNWFKENFDRVPLPTIISPKEEVSIPLRAIIGSPTEPPTLLFLGAVVTYDGVIQDRVYWAKFWRIYAIEYLLGGRTDCYLLDSKDGWDEDKNSKPDELEQPEWDKLLERPFVRKLKENVPQEWKIYRDVVGTSGKVQLE